MRFPYSLARVRQPISALAGRSVRPRPIIALPLLGPVATISRDALLDTGADDTVFAESMATRLGIDLSNAPVVQATGVGQVPASLRYAQVTLRVSDGHEFREWDSRGWFHLGCTAAAAAWLCWLSAFLHGDVSR